MHGEFETLEAILASVGFLPGCDRLFALGDLIDRGPRSADALAWMESGQIELSVRGNHEQMLLDRMEAAESDREGRTRRTAHPLGIAHPWFARDVERTSWAKWKAMIRAMPFAVTVGTRGGPIGLVHASPTERCVLGSGLTAAEVARMAGHESKSVPDLIQGEWETRKICLAGERLSPSVSLAVARQLGARIRVGRRPNRALRSSRSR